MMQDPDRGPIVYEQPLSERIRTFLRLEFLFRRARYLLGQESPWASRLTFEVIIDVMAVLSRADLKKEVIKELERHSATLYALSRNPNVAQERLQEVRDEIHSMLQALHGCETAPGHELRYNELLNAVRQRSSIPAGTCDFDLPAFHYWLEQPGSQQRRDLNDWISTFGPFESSIGLCLRIVRESVAGHPRGRKRWFLSAQPRLVHAVPDDPGRSLPEVLPVPRDQRRQAAFRDTIPSSRRHYVATEPDRRRRRIRSSLLHHLSRPNGGAPKLTRDGRHRVRAPAPGPTTRCRRPRSDTPRPTQAARTTVHRDRASLPFVQFAPGPDRASTLPRPRLRLASRCTPAPCRIPLQSRHALGRRDLRRSRRRTCRDRR